MVNIVTYKAIFMSLVTFTNNMEIIFLNIKIKIKTYKRYRI